MRRRRERRAERSGGSLSEGRRGESAAAWVRSERRSIRRPRRRRRERAAAARLAGDLRGGAEGLGPGWDCWSGLGPGWDCWSGLGGSEGLSGLGRSPLLPFLLLFLPFCLFSLHRFILLPFSNMFKTTFKRSFKRQNFPSIISTFHRVNNLVCRYGPGWP